MNSNSQEQMIYRSLAGRISLGFYSDGERFPTAQEIAGRFGVSYCPAQRALKALARDGLVRIGRGKETVVLAPPRGDYLASNTFRRRAEALADLGQSLALLSPAICLQGLARLGALPPQPEDAGKDGRLQSWKRLYRLFEGILQAMGSRMAANLYNDIGAFAENAYLDGIHALYEGRQAEELRFLHGLEQDVACAFQACRAGERAAAGQMLARAGQALFGPLGVYLQRFPQEGQPQERFVWASRKGRTRYCDLVAIDVMRKIGQGVYPQGSLLPRSEALADTYHVSVITIRRTLGRLNRLGVVRTVNGVGVYAGEVADDVALQQRDALRLDENLRTFLEMLQLLAVTCEPVLACSFPHFTAEARRVILQAAEGPERETAAMEVTGACLQAVVRCCPLHAVREVYSNLTLLLLYGNTLPGPSAEKKTDAGWAAHIRALAAAEAAGDGTAFALAFRRLAAGTFSWAKSQLVQAGVAGAQAVAEPVFSD